MFRDTVLPEKRFVVQNHSNLEPYSWPSPFALLLKLFFHFFSEWRPGVGGGGGTPYNGLYGEAPPERGTFFRLEVYKRVGISRAEV